MKVLIGLESLLGAFALVMAGCAQVLEIPEREAAPHLVCEAGSCQCELDWADCNGDLSRDGCEVTLEVDAEHCGSCGRSCLGGACLDGLCQPIVLTPEPFEVASLALDAFDDSVFFATSNEILRARLTAGTSPSVEVVHELEQEALTIVVWQGMPLWSDVTGIHSPSGTLLETPAGQRVVLMQLAGDELRYVVSSDASPAPPHHIGRLVLGGTAAPEELVSLPAVPLAVGASDDDLFWLMPISPGQALFSLEEGFLFPMIGASSKLIVPRIVVLPNVALYSHLSLGGFELSRFSPGSTPQPDLRFPTLRSFDLFDGTVFFSDKNGTVGSLPLAEDAPDPVSLLAVAQEAPTHVRGTSLAVFWFTTELLGPSPKALRARVVAVARP